MLITLTGLTASIGHASLTFNLNFENINSAGVVWNATQKAIVTQAANEWSTLFVDTYTIDVDLTFTRDGTSGNLGEWEGFYAPGTPAGDSTRPWENTVHTISFNADLMDTSLSNYLWWDNDTSTDTVASNQWDALTVARHEIGHLLGFSAGFYADDVFTGSASSPWEDLVNGSHIFDLNGLDVLLDADHGHISSASDYSNDLMVSSLLTGTRRDISSLNLNMLELAYGYEFVSGGAAQSIAAIPEPGHLAFIIPLGAFLVSTSRRQRK